jgi:hypothetical protein
MRIAKNVFLDPGNDGCPGLAIVCGFIYKRITVVNLAEINGEVG